VTNERIRQNRQKGLFNRSVVDIGLDKIQSSVVNVRGLFGNIFGYGTIILHTYVGDMTITMVSRAERIYDKLQSVIDQAAVKDEENHETKVE
jgi:hypothetical protein